MSLGGGGYDPFFESVLQDADERGVIVAVSSGNDGASSVGYPARYATTIAVGSVGFDGEVTLTRIAVRTSIWWPRGVATVGVS